MIIQKVSVLGTGVMGIDIALLFALHGFEVLLWHRASSDIAQHRLAGRIDQYIKKEVFSIEAATSAKALIQETDSDKLASTGDLVIESVPEDFDTKVSVLARFDSLMCPDSILVTNTSSFSIDHLAESLARRKNFAGFHFFNPATKMELVEIVVGKNTSTETVEELKKLAERVGKTVVIVKDTPGFIVNRLLMIQINSAIRLLENGAATAEDIDQAMQAGLGHKLGPLALADFIGIDVVDSILRSIYKTTDDPAYQPSSLLMKMIANKEFGKKSGSGFFKYGVNESVTSDT